MLSLLVIQIQWCTGGLVLWSRSFTPAAEQLAMSPASPVNSLIRDVLIEGRTAETSYEKDGYAVKWSFVNDLELIFVVCPVETGHDGSHRNLSSIRWHISVFFY